MNRITGHQLAVSQKHTVAPDVVFGQFKVPEKTTVTSSKAHLTDGFNHGIPIPGRSYQS
jgi:hypothetical protein